MAYMNQELKKEIVAEVKKVLPKGWKVSFKVEHHSKLICTVKEMPKADLQGLGHEISRKEVLRQRTKLHHPDRPQDADFYFNRFVFEDYEADEFHQNFHICARAKGVDYSADDFDHVFATGTIIPLNPTNDRQKEMISKLMAVVNALACRNHNNSDSYSDYFDTGYYMELNFGTDEKPCKLI